MDENSEQLDSYELPLAVMTEKYTQQQISFLRDGFVMVKFKRTIINVENDGEGADINNQLLYRSQPYSPNHDEPDQFMQQSYFKSKKQLEDAIYLNNKLKNDRDVLVAKTTQLQSQMEIIMVQVQADKKSLKDYYQGLLGINRALYEEQMVSLINLCNSNADYNKKIIENTYKDRQKCQNEKENISTRLIEVKERLNQKNQQNDMLHEENNKLILQKQHCCKLIHEREISIQQKERQNQELAQVITQKDKDLKDYLQRISSFKQMAADLEINIRQLEEKIGQRDIILAEKQKAMQSSENALIKSKTTNKQLEEQIKQLQADLSRIQQQNNRYLSAIAQFHIKMQQGEEEMNFNESVISQLKQQQYQKQQQFAHQIQEIEKSYKIQIEQLVKASAAQRQGIINKLKFAEQERNEAFEKIPALQLKINNLQEKNIDLQRQKNKLVQEIEALKLSKGQEGKAFTNENERLRKQIARLTSQVEQNRKDYVPDRRREQQLKQANQVLEAQKQQLQAKVLHLTEEINNIVIKIKELQNLIQKSQLENDQLRKQLEDQRTKSLSNKHNSSNNQAFAEELQRLKIVQRKLTSTIGEKDEQLNEWASRYSQLDQTFKKLQLTLEKYVNNEIEGQNDPHQLCSSELEEQRAINLNQITHEEGKVLYKSQRYPPQTKFSSNSPKSLYSPGKKEIFGVILEQQFEQNSKIVIEEQSKHEHKHHSIHKQKLIDRGRIKSLPSEKQDERAPSIKSGTSYKKVSHTAKIKSLQQDFTELKKQSCAKDQQIKKKINQIGVLRKQVEHLRSARGRPGLSSQHCQVQVNIEDQKMHLIINQKRLLEEELGIARSKIKQLEDELKEYLKKQVSYEAKILQLARAEDQLKKQIQNHRLIQRQNEELEDKLRKQRQGAQQTRLANKELTLLYDSLLTENKKIKKDNQLLSERVQKLMPNQLLVKDLSEQVQEAGKKSLEQTKLINHLKLEKQNLEEEIKILKKKNSEYSRVSLELEQKIISLERTIEEFKRRQSKLKRQVEDEQEEVRRGKHTLKKYQEQLQSHQASYSAGQLERRKHMELIGSLQDQISKKQYEHNRLHKQIQKWKVKAEQREESRAGRKNQLQNQIEKLQSEVIKKQKQLLQERQQLKLLKGRLQILERQNKRVMDQKNQTYGQKLKYYIDQMSNIKKLLNQYQHQNQKLRISNAQIFQAHQSLRFTCDKLQVKCDQSTGREAQILDQRDLYMSQNSQLKQHLNISKSQLFDIEMAFSNLKKELQDQKFYQKKLNDKIQNLQKDLQKSKAQVMALKIKISDYQTNQQIGSKISERYHNIERQKITLDEELRKIKAEHQTYITLYIYKRDDLQKAVTEARTHERRQRQDELKAIIQQNNKNTLTKTQRLEQQISDMYNQNNRMRAEIQGYLEDGSKLRSKIIDIETQLKKASYISSQLAAIQQSKANLEEQLKKKTQRINKLQISTSGLEGELSMKQRDIQSMKKTLKQKQQKIAQLNLQLSQRKMKERKLKQSNSDRDLHRYSQTRAQQETTTHKMQINQLTKLKQLQLIQPYQLKLKEKELEIERIKDKEAKLVDQNLIKMKGLERKINQMSETMKQREEAIQRQYEQIISDLEDSIVSVSQELQQRNIHISELGQILDQRDAQLRELQKQKASITLNSNSQREELYAEIQRLKANLKQNELAYNKNIKSISQQMQKSQINNMKLLNSSNSKSRVNEAQERAAKKYEEKIRLKDKKIQQLKQNILQLEQGLIKLKKRQQTIEQLHQEVEEMRVLQNNGERQRLENQQKLQYEIANAHNANKELKKQLYTYKQYHESSTSIIQQQKLELESLKCELETIRGLHRQLQAQLEKRKVSIEQHLEQDNTLNSLLTFQSLRKKELEETMIEGQKIKKQQEIENRKKNAQVKKYQTIIEEMKHHEQEIKGDNKKLALEIDSKTKAITSLTDSLNKANNECKQLKSENIKIKQNLEELKRKLTEKEYLIKQIQQSQDGMASRLREADTNSSKYLQLCSYSLSKTGLSLDQLVNQFLANLSDREQQYNMLVEEIEELKFEIQRKSIDNEELHRENVSLKLQVEENDTIGQQIDTLRTMCDQLEQQKKILLFRHQVVRMQLESLAKSFPEAKSKISSLAQELR